MVDPFKEYQKPKPSSESEWESEFMPNISKGTEGATAGVP